MSDRSFDGRVVAITGGGSGMGRAFALDLAAQGAHVAVCGRRLEPLEETVALVEQAGGRGVAIACDVRDPEQVDAFFAAAEERFGPVDSLINNAAGNFVCEVLELSPGGWRAVVDIVLNGTFNCTRAFGLRYRDAGLRRGAVLSVVATYAWTGNPGTAHSAAAKAGVIALSRSLAVEWGPLGVRLNCIAPGPVDAPGAAREHLFPTDAIRDAMSARVPLGRLAAMADVVAAARWLLSDESAFVNGDVLVLDGGATLEQGMFAGAGATRRE